MRTWASTCTTCPHLKPAVAGYKLEETQYKNGKEMPASKFLKSLLLSSLVFSGIAWCCQCSQNKLTSST